MMSDHDVSPVKTPSIIDEEWGEEGVRGVVERFLSDKVGEIMVRVTRPVKVMFHAGQVMLSSGDSFSPLLELHSSTQLPFIISVGQEVRLNARRVQGSKYDLQVRFVTTYAIIDFKKLVTFNENDCFLDCRPLLCGWETLLLLVTTRQRS